MIFLNSSVLTYIKQNGCKFPGQFFPCVVTVLQGSNEGQILLFYLGSFGESVLLYMHCLNWLVYCGTLASFRQESSKLYQQLKSIFIFSEVVNTNRKYSQSYSR